MISVCDYHHTMLHKLIRFITVTAVISFLALSTAYTRQSTVLSLKGKVLGKDSAPIESAYLRVYSIVDSTDYVEASTDRRGNFSIETELALPLRILVIAKGYDEHRTTIQDPGEADLIIQLQSKAEVQYLRIAGKAVDATNDDPIEFAAIQVISADGKNSPERPIGAVTNQKGGFDFNFRYSVPYKLKVSHISYAPTEVLVEQATFHEVKIKLVPLTVEGEAIYVTSEIYPEEDLRESGTTDKISTVDVEQVASFSVFDLVSSLREVDVATQSMNLQSVSTRGFNTGANPRFLQLTDGIDNLAPGLGFPIGNLMGPSELDIAGLELLIGPASARYGSSAMNGALLTTSKSPFIYEGVAVNLKTGIHHIKLGGSSPWGIEGDNMFDGSFRIAKVLGDKFAFKLTGTRIQGQDWRATNYDNIGPGKPYFDTGDVPGYNGVNIYGDENSVLLPVGVDSDDAPDGSYVPVTRTGYREIDLVDYNIATTKASASLYYKFNENAMWMVEGRYGYTNTLYTSDSRIRLENFEILQGKTELTINDFYLRAYSTNQSSGDSYNVSYLSKKLIEEAKSDFNWYRDFEIAFTRGLPIYQIPRGDIAAARRFADRAVTLLQDQTAEARFEPGTPEFDERVKNIKSTFDFDEGAGIKDDSKLYHIETGNKSDDLIDGVELNYGASFRFYDLESAGTIFPDTLGNDITNYEYGGYLQFEKQLANDRLNILGAFRVDKNENFAPRSSQQIGFTYELSNRQFVRFSYQNGFRYPTVREQFLNTNLGDARLLGGLYLVTDPYELQNNSFYESAVQDFNDAVNDELEGNIASTEVYNRPQAELKNLGILETGILAESGLTKIKPEKTNAFEVGFRQLFTDNFYLDLNYFLSMYNDFIGIKRFIKPRTSPVEDLYSAAGQINSSLENDRYYVYSNASSLVFAHGMAFDLKYSSGTFVLGLNGTFTTLAKSSDDPIVPGYNTPPVKINFEWGNREIVENVGFKFNFKYRTRYDWESSFLDGSIESYGHFDFQFNFRIPKAMSTIKLGVSNMSTTSYYNVYGGPAVGSLLFATYSFNPRDF
mgnify:CR=1 FL=1